MSSIATDQVNIDVEQMTDANKHNTLRVGELAVDGRHRSGYAERSGHNHHGSNDSHHDNDVDDKHRSKRSRRRSRSRSRSHSPSHRNKRTTETAAPPTERDVKSNSHDVEPLLVTDTNHKKHTELDNEEDSDENIAQHDSNSNNSGVDDGFFVGIKADTDDDDAKNHHQNHNHTDHNVPHDNMTPFPYAPGYNPNIIFDSAGNPQAVPDINVYQQKKNLAQGMMDLALLSANANQLRYVVETYKVHPYYWFSLISISISLILQVAVGVGLILNSRYNIKNREQICRADKINNFTIIGIFLITTVNVFITAFGVAPAPT